MNTKIIIRVEHRKGKEVQFVEDLPSFAERQFDCSDYGAGQIETLQSVARNCSRALGLLLSNLLEKGLITDYDALSILGVYNPGQDVRIKISNE